MATVLVIDDDPYFRNLMQHCLEAEGFTVLTAPDGVTGKGEAVRCRPDVILLDVVMPDQDGYVTCQQLKSDEITRTIPVLIITGEAEHGMTDRAYESGASACISKLIPLPALLSTLRAALHAHLSPSP